MIPISALLAQRSLSDRTILDWLDLSLLIHPPGTISKDTLLNRWNRCPHIVSTRMKNIQAAGLAVIQIGYGYYTVNEIAGASFLPPDSAIFDMGVRHERARVLQLLEQRREDLRCDETSGWNAYRRRVSSAALSQAITSILEAK